jgi:hypothetical protein
MILDRAAAECARPGRCVQVAGRSEQKPAMDRGDLAQARVANLKVHHMDEMHAVATSNSKITLETIICQCSFESEICPNVMRVSDLLRWRTEK